MVVKSVLILTASFGEGHNAAARNLREAILAAAPGTNCIVSDIFRDAYGGVVRMVEQGYLAIINHLPLLWQTAFEILDRTRLVEQHIGVYGAAARRLNSLILQHRPSVVVSTYPGCNHLLDHLYRRRLKRPFKLVTVITDSLTINSVWHRAQSDYLLVANDATADVLTRAGVPLQKIRIFGFPVPRVFASLNGVRTDPPLDGRWRILYVINSGRHVAPDIVRCLLNVEDIALTVTTGRDEDLARRLSALTVSGKKVDILGWAPDMPRLMAQHHLLISKAGGATVQESLAARTPMIITQVVPGQEEGNARLVLDRNAGTMATTPRGISEATRKAFSHGAQEWHAWQQAAASLGRPAAADDTARFVLNLTEVSFA